MTYNVSMKISLMVTILLLASTTTLLAADHEILTRLLVDLKDWRGEKAKGMTMDMGSTKMINATRQYRNGNMEISAMIFLGNQAMTQGQIQAMKVETDEDQMSISEIDGFKVQSHYNKKDKSGSIVVYLSQGQSPGGMFTLTYKGPSLKQGLSLAKKFNWNDMKLAIEKLF